MLSFEEKSAILEGFSELNKKPISMNRVNYHYEESLYDKTIVVEKLHPNGNGFVFVGDLEKYKDVANEKGLVNIREFDEESLRTIIKDAIHYLSEDRDILIEETWISKEGMELKLVHHKRDWNIYYNNNLEESFGTREAAEAYLREDGFKLSDK